MGRHKHTKLWWKKISRVLLARRPLLIGLLVLIILSPISYLIIRSASPVHAWFNDLWQYRRAVSVTNSSGGTLTNYPVSFTIDTATLISQHKLQSSCADIRVTDANAGLLSYWIEESGSGACNLTTTKVWANIPSLPTSGTTIYVYYGNTSAVSAAAGSSVFDLFDSFTSVDGSKWNTTGSPTANGSLSLTNGAVLASKNTYTNSNGVGRLIAAVSQSVTNLAGGKLGFSNTSDPTVHTATDKSAALIIGSTEETIAGYGGTNLVSHHTLEETTTTDANLFKPSGYLDTGKLNQAVSMYGNAAGTQGSTLTFNRGAQISGNNYEHLNTNQGSISLWVKPSWNGNDNLTHIIFTGSGTGAIQIFKYTSNSLYFSIAGVADMVTTNISSWTAGTWYLVTARWNANNPISGSNYVCLGINGTETCGRTSGWTITAPSSNQYIGSSNTSGSSANALIDDFAIWDRPLTTTEIAGIYNAGTGAEAGTYADPSLKFYAKMDGSGTLSPVTYNLGSSASKMTAASTELTGGTNLVTNGNFETAVSGVPTGWAHDSSVCEDAETSNILFDSRSQKLTATSQFGRLRLDTIPVVEGNTYAYSFWAKKTGSTSIWFTFRKPDDTLTQAIGGLTTTWQKYEGVFKIPTGFGTQLRFLLYDPGTSNFQPFYIDNFSIVPSLVDNGGMEGTYVGGVAPGWTNFNATPADETTTIHSGSHSQKVVTSATNQGVTSSISTTTGNWYLTSFWAYTTSGSFRLNIGGIGDTTWTNSASWQKISTVWKAANAGPYNINFYSNNAATFYVDDVSVVPLDNVAGSFQSWTPVQDYPGQNSTELVANGTFEGAYSNGVGTGWNTGWPNGAPTIDTTTYYNGSHSQRYDHNNTSLAGGIVIVNPLAINDNSYYKVSTAYRKNGLGTVTIDPTGGYGGAFLPNSQTWTTYSKIWKGSDFNLGHSGANYRLSFYSSTPNNSWWVDDVSVKEVPDPLSVQGSLTGVGSTAPGARGNAYIFDGSTGYLRQKTYAMNIGVLSYGTNTFSDSGQTFTNYKSANPATYMIVITNSDNTITWSYLGTGGASSLVNVYTSKTEGTAGFNGQSPAGETPIGYEIRKTDYQITSSAFTLGAWIKTSSTNIGQIMSKYTNGIAGIMLRTNYPVVNKVNFTDSNGDAIASNTSINDGNWHYIVYVAVSGSNHQLYVDGVLDNSDTTSSAGYSDNYNAFQIGARFFNNTTDSPFPGSIDSPFVMSTALTADQIRDIYLSSANHYGLSTTSGGVATVTAGTGVIDIAYHTYTVNSTAANVTLTQDGTTLATNTTNLPATSDYIRLENRDPSNTLTVDWVVFAKGNPSDTSTSTTTNEEKTNQPVAYWALDEGQGTLAHDSTVNRNDGTVSGASWATEDLCISGKCLYFNGSSPSVSVSNSINTVKSVSFWVKSASSSAALVTLSSGANVIATNGTITANGLASPIIYVDGRVSTTFTVNSWHHIEITTATAVTGSAITLGLVSNNYLQGFLDEVKLYDYTRTSAQVKTDYNAGAGKAKAAKGVVATIGAGLVPADPLANGLVGYWKLDESSGNAIDSSGNSNTGTWNGTGTNHYTAGHFGNGGGFNGTDDDIEISNPNILGVTANLTISAWIKTSASNGSIYGEFSSEGNSTRNFLDIASGKVGFDQYPPSGGSITSTTSVNTGQWVHVVYTQKNNLRTIYINGVRDKQDTTPEVYSGSAPTAARIGYRGSNQTSYTFNGTLDDVRIYNRALSPEEVSQLYNWAPGPVARYSFDEGSGTTVNDISGYGNNGSLGVGNSAPAWNNGKFGKALQFNGSSTYARVTGNSLFNFNYNQDFTVSTWLKAPLNQSGTAAPARRVIDFSGSVGYPFTMWFRSETGSPADKITVARYDGTHNPGITTTNTYNDNQWHYVTFSKNSSTLSLYIDGKLDQTTIDNTTTSTLSDNNLYFGSYIGTSNFFNGALDDVRIYNYARTQKQIVSDMQGNNPSGISRNGPIAFYKFDEGQGTVAHDVTFNQNNGTLNNFSSPATATSGWTTDGKVGKALVFDGTDDYISLGNPTNLNFGTGAFSASGWVKWTKGTTINTFAGWLSKGGYSTGLELRFVIGATGTYSIDGFIGNLAIGGAYPFSPNTWYHVAFTRDDAGNWKEYVNSQLKYSGVNTQSIGADNWEIGRMRANNGLAWNGSIDEVKIYPYALTADEVKLDYNQGSATVMGSATGPGSVAAEKGISGTLANGLVGWWKLDESSGAALDASGNNNTGTWSGTGSNHYTTGKFGGGGGFNGTDDIVTTSMSLPTTNLSASAWIYPTDLTTFVYHVIVNAVGIKFYTYGNGLYCYLYSSNGGQSVKLTSLTANTWNHVACTYDGKQANVYVNGAIGTPQAVSGTISSASVNLGHRSGSDYFAGTMDDVRIYNRALSSDEVAELYSYAPPPVAEYLFDEGSGTTANDTSGNNDTGTWSGTGNHYTNGKFGKAGLFNGANSYVDIGKQSPVNNLINAVTVSMWVEPTNTATEALFDRSTGGGGNSGPFYLWWQNSKFRFSAANGTTSAGITSATYPINNWYFVTGTFDGTNVNLYINGILNNSTSQTITPVDRSTVDWLIGAFSGSPTHTFNGIIDNVQVYNYARTPAQIAYDFNRGAPVARYEFDECQGTTAHNTVPTANKFTAGMDGTIVIGASGTQTSAGTCADGLSTSAWSNGKTGHLGHAMSFDGTDDYVCTKNGGGSCVDLDSLDFTNTLSVSAWVKKTANGAIYNIVNKSDFNLTSSGYWLQIRNDNRAHFRIGNSTDTDVASLNTITDTNWHLLTGTYDGAYDRIYIDGELANSAAATGTIGNDTHPFYIGAGTYNGVVTSYFPGLIDDVRVYSYPLTPSQVKTLYNNGSVNFGQ